jgi:hypothetical protein
MTRRHDGRLREEESIKEGAGEEGRGGGACDAEEGWRHGAVGHECEAMGQEEEKEEREEESSSGGIEGAGKHVMPEVKKALWRRG